jgi:hypothetical protein
LVLVLVEKLLTVFVLLFDALERGHPVLGYGSGSEEFHCGKETVSGLLSLKNE